jgi:hypothetical protein
VQSLVAALQYSAADSHWARTGGIWTLLGARLGRLPGAVREIVVVCPLGGGEPRGVGDTLGDSVSS